MDENRLKKQMDFIMEIDKAKQIFRQTYISDASRKENDAEHSWHLAVMCMVLSEYATNEIDVLHTMKMVLIHDLIEIYAGDTYAYDEEGNDTKKQREQNAADKIFGMLPNDQGKLMRKLWDEFEENNTPEANFAVMLDNIQPLLLNDKTGGLSWREHKVLHSQIAKRNERTKDGSVELYEYCKERVKENIKKGNIIEDK